MAFDVITYAGGESYRDAFIAVALMTRTGAISSLVRLGLLRPWRWGAPRTTSTTRPRRFRAVGREALKGQERS